jgi:transglutaminase-like putative cysteine protease
VPIGGVREKARGGQPAVEDGRLRGCSPPPFLGFCLRRHPDLRRRLARGATGRWYTIDARHNHPRIGRIVMGRGRDAADVAMSTAFGIAKLARFEVVTQEQVQAG